MKLLKYLFISIIIFTSCKSHKNIIDSTVKAKKMTEKRVVRKHFVANFNKKTIYSKFKIIFKNSKVNAVFYVRMKMEKDKVIWLKGTKLITVFKVKITPTSVSYYSPYKKDYFEGDFSLLKKILGIDINFKQLQNMLLGQAITNIKNEKQKAEIQDNSYMLSSKNLSNLFRAFFYVNPSHFKLDKQVITHSIKNQQLTILYPKYLLKDNVIFPSEINIKSSDNQKVNIINMTLKSVVFNTKLSMPFKIPKGYKRISF